MIVPVNIVQMPCSCLVGMRWVYEWIAIKVAVAVLACKLYHVRWSVKQFVVRRGPATNFQTLKFRNTQTYHEEHQICDKCHHVVHPQHCLYKCQVAWTTNTSTLPDSESAVLDWFATRVFFFFGRPRWGAPVDRGLSFEPKGRPLFPLTLTGILTWTASRKLEQEHKTQINTTIFGKISRKLTWYC